MTITAPADGAQIPLDKVTAAKYKCVDRESGLDTCVGTVAERRDARHLDGRRPHVHRHGHRPGRQRDGGDRALPGRLPWNGLLQPDLQHRTPARLNLVHAGDLIKLGFGLDGDRGLNVFADGYPTSELVACPVWTPHSVPAAGAGADAGARLRRRVGPLHLRLADQAAWAGTCRRFEIVLNDGSGTVHTARLQFFQ